jgi:hypothetical protein
LLEKLREKGFEVRYESHAAAILEHDFPDALKEIEQALCNISIPITEIIGSGGGETQGTQRMKHAFYDVDWKKFTFEVKRIINGVEREAISHEIDHVKKFDKFMLALEIEWNNKDPFFDRDLENFKRLHADGAISTGIIVTRATSLHEKMWDFVNRFAREQKINGFDDLERLNIELTKRQKNAIKKRVERTKKPIEFTKAWTDQFVHDKYGEATTHWRKLMDRISRGVGNPCPLLLIGLPASLVTFEVSGPITYEEAVEVPEANF